MPNVYYDAPYLDETEHATTDHTGIPGVGGGGGSLIFSAFLGNSGMYAENVLVGTSTEFNSDVWDPVVFPAENTDASPPGLLLDAANGRIVALADGLHTITWTIQFGGGGGGDGQPAFSVEMRDENDIFVSRYTTSTTGFGLENQFPNSNVFGDQLGGVHDMARYIPIPMRAGSYVQMRAAGFNSTSPIEVEYADMFVAPKFYVG